MTDPVVGTDGQTYDRTSITEWLAREPISPITRQAMSVADLRPNVALRSQIQDYIARNGALAAMPALTPPAKKFAQAPITIASVRNAEKLHIRVASATGAEQRQPIVLIPIIDNSGSMNEPAAMSQGTENLGFSRLDLVLYAVRVMASILADDDYMGVVSFSTEARIVINPVAMTDDGKARINAALDRIRPDANTNIWDGIRKAASIANNPAFKDQNIVAMLLTDGFPNMNPPRGIVRTLQTMKMTNPWTLHTFGFGYQLDSALLAEIAEWGKGLFGFIPDASMVGTVFINALAHALTTATSNVSLSYKLSPSAPPVTLDLGPIAHGQPRDIILDLPADADPTVNDAAVPHGTVCEYALIHNKMTQVITAAIQLCRSDRLFDAQAALATFEVTHKACSDPNVKALLRDIKSDKDDEGQIGMAPSYFSRWGEHYMRAYLRAQQLQQCMNFKDPGLQIYGGDLFHALQDAGDTAFASLPVPKASLLRPSYGATAAAPAASLTSMSVFHNASSGCFAPNTGILLADGTRKTIDSLVRGDSVWTPSGPASVTAVVSCGTIKRTQPMSIVSGLCITPWHPIRIGGVWNFPADIVGYADRIMPAVFNLILSSGHIVDADGIEACTLGHGFTEDVVKHEFFGSQKVIDDIAKQPGWLDGAPVFVNLATRRDPDSGMICGWYDDI